LGPRNRESGLLSSHSGFRRLSPLALVLPWVNDGLPRPIPAIFTGWFLLAFALQLFGPTTGAWALGLLLQTALIALLMKQQLERL